MKTFRISILAMLACTVLACHEEETSLGKGEFQIQFSVAASTQNPSGRVQLIPEGAKIRLSLEDESGNQVFTLKEIALLRIGLDYVTEPLEFEVKGYRVTDFFIVSEDDHILFAVPREGLTLARLVRRPLPIFFNIGKGKLVNINAQVVRVEDGAGSQEFGYASFSVEEAAYPEFSVSVLAMVNGDLRHVASQVYLIHEGDTIYQKGLPASKQEILFKGKPHYVYTLVVTREHHSRYIKTFQLQALTDSLKGRPLQIILGPAFNFTVDPNSHGPYGSSILFKIEGVEGSTIYIDWGDGQTDTLTLKEEMEPDEYVSHEYNDPWQPFDVKVDYFVSVTGNLHDIRSVTFGDEWDESVKYLSIKQLSGLRQFSMIYNHHLRGLDFSGNPELRSIYLASTALHYINILDNRKLKNIHLESIEFNTPEVDRFISDLYTLVTTYTIRDGYLLLNSAGKFPGPPSSGSLQKIDVLRNNYGWDVRER